MENIKPENGTQGKTEVTEEQDKVNNENTKLEVAQVLYHNLVINGHSMKASKGDLLQVTEEGHSSVPDLSVIQHYFGSLTSSGSPHRNTASTQNKRQTAALELLESERVYVSYLSLLLKANISFNGSEALISKDKRPFPSSLRFLIQQHLDLLHTLQERVLKSQWQGIMGDVFMKLISKESDFLDFYVSYLKDLPDCLSVVSMLTSSRLEAWDDMKTSYKRQTAALELLESERVYVSYLSLLLKANISFNGSEALISKDKRPFPSSLRFLIQQHLDLLHTLQERVLKSQWQGIMGDVFMKLISKESDFLDFYVSYLKDLPDCLSVVSMLTSSRLESDIMGDGSRPSLHTLLLQPVHRTPEYLLLLQGLLRQTGTDHPDYYMLVVCIQQFRSFTAQYHHLLTHNQDLLFHTRRELKRSTKLIKTVECGTQASEMGSHYPSSAAIQEHASLVKHSKQRLLQQIQSRNHFHHWDRDQEADSQRYHHQTPLNPVPLFSPDKDPRNHTPSAGLHSIPEREACEDSVSPRQHLLCPRPSELHLGTAGSALADALGEFLLPKEALGMEGLYEEDGDSVHDTSVFDQCSSASSDSSTDNAFMPCPRSTCTLQQAVVSVPCTRDVYVGGGQASRCQHPNQGCVSPDETVMMRHRQHCPLQASQGNSKSLNSLQLDSTVVDVDSGQLSDPLHRGGVVSHAKLERQGSKGRKRWTSIRRGHISLDNTDTDKWANELCDPGSKAPGIQSWGEELKWRNGAEESHHTPLSERSRKQEKGGFRNSFKKLFKKKSGEQKKEKEEKPSENSSDHETPGKNQQGDHLEVDRGTAV